MSTENCSLTLPGVSNIKADDVSWDNLPSFFASNPQAHPHPAAMNLTLLKSFSRLDQLVQQYFCHTLAPATQHSCGCGINFSQDRSMQHIPSLEMDFVGLWHI